MRFDQAHRDAEVGGYESIIHVDRRPGSCCSEMPVLTQASCVVVADSILTGDVCPHDCFYLDLRCGPMHSGGDQDCDVLPGDASLFQSTQDCRQNCVVRHGPGNVADGNSSGPLALCQLAQGGGCY